MQKRQVVLESLAFREPPYVPWAWDMTLVCARNLRQYLGANDLDHFIDSHFLDLGAAIGRFDQLDENHFRDQYGVVWDRSVDRDIGTPLEYPIKKQEDLKHYQWPDANQDSWYAGMAEALQAHPDRFSRYMLGFSLYERAWTMRGMSQLLIDMLENPDFVDRLLDAITEHNLVQIHRACEIGVDAVYFGDDYGSQQGLIMGLRHWRRFIKPRLARMFAAVRERGKYVCMHSCGCVAELFDDLVEIGLNMFNPFQPEVMDIQKIKKQRHGRLAFHGGMSVQRVLPFGSVDEVRQETRNLIEMGRDGGYIFSPSHSVPPDVPPENLVAMMEILREQTNYPD
jgi:uroporphyrinogen decarboxylase